jgi:hypothetical protein
MVFLTPMDPIAKEVLGKHPSLRCRPMSLVTFEVKKEEKRQLFRPQENDNYSDPKKITKK